MLCTTEAHKIPATIASRCQHFSFRSVDFEDLIAPHGVDLPAGRHRGRPRSARRPGAAGEGSVRDSLSALDQAIACCGAKLNAAEVRALLGAFSLESLEKVTQALAGGDSRSMLEVVDELERNGQNLQHFSRELSRYFRNLLVARSPGADTRLVAASAAQREKLGEIAGGFSEEDLTRYLQLSLDLFKDLQSSLQPRFHLEIGLVRLVQAGRLLPIEQALAGLGPAPPRHRRASGPARRHRRPAWRRPRCQPLPRSRPVAVRTRSREESRHAAARTAILGRQRSGAASRSAAPMTAGDPRERLHAYLHEKGNAHLADAVENASHHDHRRRPERRRAEILRAVFQGSRLRGRRARSLRPAPAHEGHHRRSGRRPAPISLAAAQADAEDEATGRALANPEVQRFREVFGGEVRKVRNLKE